MSALSRTVRQIPICETVEFIQNNADAGSSILEIGGGSGDVALALDKAGHCVVTLDSNEQLAKIANGRGINAHHATWPCKLSESFDVIVFTRSLHHHKDLQAALRAALDALDTNGKLLLEEFAYDLANDETIRWFVRQATSAFDLRLVDESRSEFLTPLIDSPSPLQEWIDDHQGHIATSADMISAAELHFESATVDFVPYFYRYLAQFLDDSNESARFVAKMFRDEQTISRDHDFRLVGLRVIAWS